MVKQLLLPLAGVAAFIIIVGLLVKNSGNITVPGLTFPTPTPSSSTVAIAGKTIQVEVANNKTSREQGLSGRTNLAPDHGMLFVFDSKQVIPTFWMKGMLIPLDFVWISGGSIVKLDNNVQPPSPNTADRSLKIYSPGQPIDYVLEVNAGFSDSNNIKVGDTINLSGI